MNVVKEIKLINNKITNFSPSYYVTFTSGGYSYTFN